MSIIYIPCISATQILALLQRIIPGDFQDLADLQDISGLKDQQTNLSLKTYPQLMGYRQGHICLKDFLISDSDLKSFGDSSSEKYCNEGHTQSWAASGR